MKDALGFVRGMLVPLALIGAAVRPVSAVVAIPADPGCEGYQVWTTQSNPRSDSTGLNNSAYPEANATYWATQVTGTADTMVTTHGQYPLARYVSFQLYDDNRNVLDSLNDVAINPDSGQNNPYRSGTDQGTYTVHLVFGRKPIKPRANTIYTAGLTSAALVYRIYYSNNPDDLSGSTPLPSITIDGVEQISCPPRPIIVPEDATVWGRLDNGEFFGNKPSNLLSFSAANPPIWSLVTTNQNTPYYPSEDNSYMAAVISRDYLNAPFPYDLLVLRFAAPTVPDTQAGVPPYAAAQVRFWSLCQDEPITTSVVRCTPDNVALNRDGFVTFVVSDPSKRPADDILAQWGAGWMPWGALQPNDVVYDIDDNPLTNASGVFYNGLLLYRQTMADPFFAQSIANVAQLSPRLRKDAMGDYWPAIGYCSAASFQTLGSGCIGQ